MVRFVYIKINSHSCFEYTSTAPTAPPDSVNGTSINPFTISLWWDEPPPNHQNGIIRYYVVHVLEMQTGRFWTIYSVDTTLLVGALHPYYVYECNIAAITIRAGPLANITIRTKEARKPNFAWT